MASSILFRSTSPHYKLCISVAQLSLSALLLGSTTIFAQSVTGDEPTATVQSPSEQREATLAAERYEKMVRSRPQFGPAFDKFYADQIQRQTLEEFYKGLRAEIAEANAGVEETGSEIAVPTKQVLADQGKLLLLAGMIEYRRGEDATALDSFTQAERLIPVDPYPSYYLGQVYLRSNKSGEALEAWQRAIKRKPPQTLLFDILKATTQSSIQSEANAGLDQIYRTVEQLYPSNPQALKLLAESMAKFSPQDAKRVYEKLIPQLNDPAAKIEAQMQRAAITARLGDSFAAAVELRGLLSRVNPDSWLYDSIFDKIDALLVDSADAGGLIEFYEQRLADEANNLPLMLRFAQRLSETGRTQEAIQWANKARELAPNSVEPLQSLALLYAQQNELRSAAATMEQVVALEPNNPDAIELWGRYVASDATQEVDLRQSQAVSIWRRLLVGKEADPVVLVRVADLLSNSGAKQDALKLYQQASQVASDEDKPEYIQLLADYLFALDRRDDAKVAAESIGVIPAVTSDSLLVQSELLRKYGFAAESLAALAHACDLQPNSELLVRLCERLVEAGRFEEALPRLAAASELTKDPDEFAAIWDTTVRSLRQSSDLAMKLGQFVAKNTDQPASESAWQQLALMQEASSDYSAAASTSNRFVERNAGSLVAWLLNERMQGRAGVTLQQMESLQKLATLDAANQHNYLSKLARIQLSLNKTDEAIKTSAKLLSLPTTSPREYHQFAKLLRDADQRDRSFDILRQCVERFPNDRQSLSLLASELAMRSNTSEAIELAWKSLQVSRDAVENQQTLQQLEELYRKTSGADLKPQKTFFDALIQFGKEHNREREAALWACQSAAFIDDSSEVLKYVDSVQRRLIGDSELLRAAARVAESNGDRARVEDYLVRLNQFSPNPITQLQLGRVLSARGEKELARKEWSAVARRSDNAKSLADFTNSLLSSGDYAIARELANVTIEHQPTSWELVVLAILANHYAGDVAETEACADRLLAINVPPQTRNRLANSSSSALTADYDRLAWMERASPWQSVFNRLEIDRAAFRSFVGDPKIPTLSLIRQLAAQRGASIRVARPTSFDFQTFGDARALTVLVKFGMPQAISESEQAKLFEFHSQATKSRSADQLWDCVLILRPIALFVSRNSSQVAELYQQSIDSLVELNEPNALELAIVETTQQRQMLRVKNGRQIAAMEPADLDRFARRMEKSFENGSQPSSLSGAVLAAELLRADRDAEANEVIARTLSAANGSEELAKVAASFAEIDRKLAQTFAIKALTLELQTGLYDGYVTTALTTIYDAASRSTDSSPEEFLAFVRLLFEVETQHWQKSSVKDKWLDHTAAAAPAPPFPLPSPALSRTMLVFLSFIHRSPASATKQAISDYLVGDATGEASTRLVHALSACAWSWREGEQDVALEKIRDARSASNNAPLIAIMEAELLIEMGRESEVIPLMQIIKPQNSLQQRDRCVALFLAASATGNDALARQSVLELQSLPVADLPSAVIDRITK